MRVDMDTCEEILVTITRNKTRSLLTAFGVFWGIFMLVALMGGGQGMQEMMQAEFEGFATNSGFMASQKTGEAYKGFRKGRYWDIENADIERIRKSKRHRCNHSIDSPLGIDSHLWREKVRLQRERALSGLCKD